jgi:hypothetical protein
MFDPAAWAALALLIAVFTPPAFKSPLRRFLVIILTVSFFSIASPFGSQQLLSHLELKNPEIDSVCADPLKPKVWVLLSSGAVRIAENENDISALDLASYARTTGLADYLKEFLHAKDWIVVTGAQVHEDSTPVSVLMASLLKRISPYSLQLVTEELADNTAMHPQLLSTVLPESVLNTRPLCIVTSASHMPRSLFVFEQAGFEPKAAPVDFKANDPFQFHLGFFWPWHGSLDRGYEAIHEYVGLFWYKLKIALKLDTLNQMRADVDQYRPKSDTKAESPAANALHSGNDLEVFLEKAAEKGIKIEPDQFENFMQQNMQTGQTNDALLNQMLNHPAVSKQLSNDQDKMNFFTQGLQRLIEPVPKEQDNVNN